MLTVRVQQCTRSVRKGAERTGSKAVTVVVSWLPLHTCSCAPCSKTTPGQSASIQHLETAGCQECAFVACGNPALWVFRWGCLVIARVLQYGTVLAVRASRGRLSCCFQHPGDPALEVKPQFGGESSTVGCLPSQPHCLSIVTCLVAAEAQEVRVYAAGRLCRPGQHGKPLGMQIATTTVTHVPAVPV